MLVALADESEQYDYLQYGPMTGYTWQTISRHEVVSAKPDLLVYAASDYLDVWRKKTGQSNYRYQRVTRHDKAPAYKGEFLKVALTGGSLQTRDYGYDANGIVTDITTPAGIHGYGYDALDRLVNDAQPGFDPIGLGYDANGNRTSRSQGAGVVPYGYQPNSNVLTDVEGSDVTHDAAGNRISDPEAATVHLATTMPAGYSRCSKAVVCWLLTPTMRWANVPARSLVVALPCISMI